MKAIAELNHFAAKYPLAITTASIGFVLTVLAFTSEWFGSHLEYAVIPGTIVFLVASGGEAGGPDIMTFVGGVLAVIANTFLYALPGLLLDRLRRWVNEN